MKETICVRLEYELIQKLGLDKAPNKSDYLREILREYVRLKESEKTYLEVGEKLGILKEDLNAIKTELGNLREIKTALESLREIKTALGKYEIKKEEGGKEGTKVIPLVEIVEKIYWRVKGIEEILSEDVRCLYTLIGIGIVIILQVLVLLLK